MADPLSVWGIDVGKCALKAVKLRIGADKAPEAAAVDSIEHAKIMSQSDADKDALWSAALEKFLSRNDLSGDKVVVAVPAQLTLPRFSKLPPVDKKKIPDIVRYEADQQIPFDMDEVVWDYQQFQVPDSPEVEVGIFAIKRELIRDHLLHFEAGGIEPIAVQSAPLALYNALRYEGALAKGTTVIVDIGTENTDLLVATEHTLWARNIHVGGNNFTEALVKAFKLSFGKAETLKRTAATSKYARQVFQAMRPVFSDLVQELQRSIGFYTATHRDAELNKVIGVGSAFKLPGLVKYLSQNLQMDVEKVDRFQKITLPATAEGEADEPGSLVVAYGLALQGLGQTEVNCNLLPPEIAKQIVWRKKRAFFAAAAACLLLAAGAVWFRQMTDAGTLASNRGSEPPSVASIERAEDIVSNPPTGLPEREYGKVVLAAAQKLKSESSRLRGQGNDEKQKIKTIVGLLENKVVWLRILSAIHEALPTPPGPLAEVTTAVGYKSAVEEGGSALERSGRTEIFIELFDAEFVDDVKHEQIPDEWNAMKDVIESKGSNPQPGFIITMNCRTPNKGTGLFVSETYVAKLRETGRVPGRGFYVNRIGLTERSSERGSSRRRGDRDRRGDREERPTDTTKDPLTGEPMGGDYAFQVHLDLVLADLPEPPKDQARP